MLRGISVPYTSFGSAPDSASRTVLACNCCELAHSDNAPLVVGTQALFRHVVILKEGVGGIHGPPSPDIKKTHLDVRREAHWALLIPTSKSPRVQVREGFRLQVSLSVLCRH